MSSGGMIPEKFGMYFSTMNSLSAKIYSDIQAIEEKVKFPQNLSYSEKCAILDKYLIHDVVNCKKPNQRGIHDCHSDIKESVYYDDPVLDQDQVSALLLSVFPKKPEKYVYDDNGFWIDEHSVPYSCCTQSQAKVCKLGDFVKVLPPPPITAPHKSGVGSKPKYLSNNKSNYNNPGRKHSVDSETQSEEESDFDSCPETDVENDYPGDNKNTIGNNKNKNSDSHAKPPVRTAFMGVPVMGYFGSGPPKKEIKVQAKHDIEIEDDVSNLPQQKQNSDLIAELQAKLKMNKATNKGAAPQLPQPQTQKVSKPKAPPPPPPKAIPGMAVKVTAPKAPSEKIGKKKGETTLPNKSKTQMGVQSSASVNKTGNNSGSKVVEKETPAQEFVVDVSSPCRIATPKTGFDFLDNW